MDKKPNVLIIHADQHRADCLGCFGNNQIKTPAIDALAADGVVHTNHFSTYPVCTPSRYSMLCGQYTHSHRGWSNHCTLAPGIATFPGELKSAGYKTAAVGKMHFTPTYLDVGFEKMTLAEQDGDGRFDDDYHKYLMGLGLADKTDIIDQRSEYRTLAAHEYWESHGALASDLPAEHYSTRWITREAQKVISGWDGETSNLLMVGYIKPHHPDDPPREYADLYDPETLQLLPGYLDEVPGDDYTRSPGYHDHRLLSPERLKKVMAYYYANITLIDRGVSEIISALKARGLYDNTIIIYTSDHGDYMGWHHMWGKGGFMYDPVIRVPLIIKDICGTSGQNDKLSSNVDIAPTILSLCGLEIPKSMRSKNIVTARGDEFVIAESRFGENRVEYMARTKRYKLLICGDMRQIRFYDLEKDPSETKNLRSDPDYAAQITELSERLISEVMFGSDKIEYLDENAPTADGRTHDETMHCRESVAEYYRQQLDQDTAL